MRVGAATGSPRRTAALRRSARVKNGRLGYDFTMTHDELAPFVGKNVAVYHTAGNVVTGTLVHDDPTGPYEVNSVDGEVPPVPLLHEEIVRVVA